MFARIQQVSRFGAVFLPSSRCSLVHLPVSSGHDTRMQPSSKSYGSRQLIETNTRQRRRPPEQHAAIRFPAGLTILDTNCCGAEAARSRASQRRTRIHFAALALAGCQSSHQASETPQPASAAASVAVQPVAECERVRTCLAGLPHEYAPSSDADLRKRVTACIGATPTEKWNVRACLPFEVATDTTNGRKIEAYVACTDVCPNYTQSGIRYVDVQQPECECLGGKNIGIFGIGCAPGGTSREEGPDSFEVKGDDHYELRARGSFPHVRLAYLGLDRARIDSINGTRIRDAESLRQVVRGLLTRPPANVRFWQSAHVRVAYPERGVFDRLANAAATLPLETPRLPRCLEPDAAGQARICLGVRELTCDLAKDRACATFVSEIEKAASTVTAPRPRAPVDCADLRHVPAFVAVRFHDRAVELRYIDWMPQLPLENGLER